MLVQLMNCTFTTIKCKKKTYFISCYIFSIFSFADDEYTVKKNTKAKPDKTPKPFSGKSKGSMASVVEKSLRFMDTRSTYWKQQMPVHIVKDMKKQVESRAMTAAEDDTFSKGYAQLLSEIMRCNEGNNLV